MSAPLIIYLPDEISAPWLWHMSELQHGSASSADERAGLAALGAKSIWVIMPGQWARIHSLELPKMRSQDRLSAAGFALEDALGTGLKGQHIALSADRAGVMSTVKIKAMLTALSAAGITPDAAYADYDIIGADDKALLLQGRVIVGGPDGYAVDRSLYEAMQTGLPLSSADINALSSGLAPGASLNFLQGEFTVSKFEMPALGQFLRAAALTLGLGMAWLVWQGIEARSARLQAEDLRGQTRALYESATGKTAPSNPALAVTRALRLSGGGQSAGFLSLSAILFEAVAQMEDVAVESVQYNANKDQLSVRLSYPDFESATQFERAVAAAGGALDTGGVREQGGKMVGDVTLTLGGRR